MDEDYFTIGVEAPRDDADGVKIAHVRLAGEFDLGARDELRETLLTLIDGERPDRVVVDLGGVMFIDSEAIGGILDGYVAAEQAGIAYRLTGATGVVRRVFDVIDLPRLFEPF